MILLLGQILRLKLRLLIVVLGLVAFGGALANDSNEEPMVEKIRKMAESHTQPSKKKRKTKRRTPQQESENEEKIAKKKPFVVNYLQHERVREKPRRKREKESQWTTTSAGSLRGEYRYFPEPSNDSRSIRQNLSVLGEYEYALAYEKFEAKIWNAGRKDFNDDQRTRLLPYENYLAYKSNDLQFKVGTQIENWAVSEIFHPSDVLNSRNLDSEIENTEKIGEPAVTLRMKILGGFATAYYMPMFMNPIFPANKSRLQAIDRGDDLLKPQFFDKGELKEGTKAAQQYALRYTKTFDSTDIAVHYLNAIDRQEPLFLEDFDSDGARPVFMRVHQIGTTITTLLGENLLKLDYVDRKFPDRGYNSNLLEMKQKDHSILALGYERSFSLKSGPASTIFIEWQKVLGVDDEFTRDFGLFQNDLMLGYRLSFNDIDSKELKAFLIVDLEKATETLWTMSYSQKLNNEVKLSLGMRGISAFRGGTKQLNDADHAFLNMTYYF